MIPDTLVAAIMPDEASAKLSKPLCFVIGPIGKSNSDVRDHADMLLNAVIREELEKGEFSYKVKRADEDPRPGMITDRIISDIIEADLVIADLTGLNPNVFYELGIRHMTGKPSIHIAKSETVLPFDNLGHDTIFVNVSNWQSILSARSRLAEAAKSIKNSDFSVSNPITQAKASLSLRQSEDPKDLVIAEMRDRLNNLEATLRPQLAVQKPLGFGSDTNRGLVDSIVHSIAEKVRGGHEVMGALEEAADFAKLFNITFEIVHLDDKIIEVAIGPYVAQISASGDYWRLK